jgi:dUTPase
MKTDYYHNSGFDLFIPQEVIFENEITSKFIDLEIKTEMLYYENSQFKNCGYNMHPRSSISKTPLMLANHTGIVDSGYRGSLIGAFRWLKKPTASLSSWHRHLLWIGLLRLRLLDSILVVIHDSFNSKC